MMGSSPSDPRRALFEAMIAEDDDAARVKLSRQYADALLADVQAERRRRASAPRMALRRHQDGSMDDVVIERPAMFRAEQLSENDLWMCCYFDGDHDRITFHVHWDRKNKLLVYDAGEMPDQWVDIDAKDIPG